MKKFWFKERGWVLSILAIIFCVQIFFAIDSRSHSVSDTLYGIFPYIVPTFLLLAWIASKKSGGGKSGRD